MLCGCVWVTQLKPAFTPGNLFKHPPRLPLLGQKIKTDF